MPSGHGTHNMVLVVLSTNGMKKAVIYTKHRHHRSRVGQGPLSLRGQSYSCSELVYGLEPKREAPLLYQEGC